MIRKIEAKDRKVFLELAEEFWHSTAVLAPIPRVHHEQTFELIVQGTPFAVAHLIECQGQCVGYGLLAFTYSNEAGGMVVWIEELYIRPAFQGKGYGNQYFDFIQGEYGQACARFRLEIEPENEGAQRLYERKGYVVLGYRELYREGEQGKGATVRGSRERELRCGGAKAP